MPGANRDESVVEGVLQQTYPKAVGWSCDAGKMLRRLPSLCCSDNAFRAVAFLVGSLAELVFFFSSSLPPGQREGFCWCKV